MRATPRDLLRLSELWPSVEFTFSHLMRLSSFSVSSIVATRAAARSRSRDQLRLLPTRGEDQEVLLEGVAVALWVLGSLDDARHRPTGARFRPLCFRLP
jgi:hypothetical protein